MYRIRNSPGDLTDPAQLKRLCSLPTDLKQWTICCLCQSARPQADYPRSLYGTAVELSTAVDHFGRLALVVGTALLAVQDRICYCIVRGLNREGLSDPTCVDSAVTC